MVKNNEKDKDVYKEHLLGFVLIKTKYITNKEGGSDNPNRKGETHFIRSEPITVAMDCHEGIDGLYSADLRSDVDEIVGIVPAQSGSLAVYKWDADGCGGDDLIGYEFPGVEHPDWNKVIQSMNK